MAKTRDELKEALEALATEMMSNAAAPCLGQAMGPAGKRSCLQAEEARRRKTKRPGYQNYDPKKMCQSCAAAWHVDCARLIFCFGLHDGAVSESGS